MNKLMLGALTAATAAVVGLSPLVASAADGRMDREHAARVAAERRQAAPANREQWDRAHSPTYQYNKSNGCSRYQFWDAKRGQTIVKERCSR